MLKNTAKTLTLLAAMTVITMTSPAPVYAGQSSTSFGVRLSIVGPGMPVDEHPRLPGGRVVYQTDSVLYQAIEGAPQEVRQQLSQTASEWDWVDFRVEAEVWHAVAHTQQGECLEVIARQVANENTTRLQTQSCN